MKENQYHQMDDAVTEQFFASISTMHEAACYLLDQDFGDGKQFDTVTRDLYTMAAKMEHLLEEQLGAGYQEISLTKILQSVKDTLSRLRIRKTDEAYRLSKLQFELIPLIEESFQHARYWLWAITSSERMKQYREEVPSLCGNYYIDQAGETGEYPYEVAFVVIGYNKLDYTKMCVESLLRNIPEGLRYELILVNHGSSDGTREYFESVRPTKQLDIAVNGGGIESLRRILESRITFIISNDVVIAHNTIENMLTCMRSDPLIAWVVPTTPNTSNFQTISVQYQSWEEMEEFAKKNNKTDPFRWEQRTRLCDPISAWRTAVFCGRDGIFDNSYLGAASEIAFPDDRRAFLLRRQGCKLMLAKDAYCHHFGSVTIKEDVAKREEAEAEFYLKGRQAFYRNFGIDPWGTGFCFDSAFLRCVVNESHEHVEILGINCGMGSNSLKIKEQLKEYWHNTDTKLWNITDDPNYIPDLKGISDEAVEVSSMKALQAFLEGKIFQYIVWETPFLAAYPFREVLTICYKSMPLGGKLFLRATEECRRTISKMDIEWTDLENAWIAIYLNKYSNNDR